MIRQSTTGDSRRPSLMLGKVVTIRDVDPGRGGDKIAVLAIAASPLGYAPLVAKVHFWRPPPNVDTSYFDYRRGEFYAVVAKRLGDGSFDDDQGCGNTVRIQRERFWNLVRASNQATSAPTKTGQPSRVGRLTSASYACPAVQLPSLAELIRRGRTGSARHDTLLLGKVVTVNDISGGRGGKAIARVAVAASPIGRSPLVTRVRFWRPAPGDDLRRMVYERRGFYGAVGHMRDDRTFADDEPCGITRRVGKDRFWSLANLK